MLIVTVLQGEQGLNLIQDDHLKNLRDLCNEEEILLICDEVQSGYYRTGKFFAYQHANIKPDIVPIAKGIGGGFPIGAVLMTKKVSKAMVPGTHGSTFGGFPLAAVIGKRALELIEEEKLVENSRQQGTYFLEKLKEITSPIILEVRGSGLWIALEIDKNIVAGRNFCERLLRKGMISKETHDSTVRLAPPLVIKKREIDTALTIIREIISEIEIEYNLG